MRRTLLLLLVLMSGVVNGGERVALVVGCGAYSGMPGMKLISPAADCEDVAGAFKKMGYRLVGGGAMKNLSRQKLMEAISMLASEAKGAEAAVFYFSGHGVEIGGQNYLLPVDMPTVTKETKVAEMKGRAVCVQESVMVELNKSGVETKVVVLDTCRDDPLFKESGEFRASDRAKSGYGPGFYLAFSTSPGAEAFDGNGKRNSPFTEAFLNCMQRAAGKDIDLFFREVKSLMPQDQVSWTSSSLKKEFSLGQTPDATAKARAIFSFLSAKQKQPPEMPPSGQMSAASASAGPVSGTQPSAQVMNPTKQPGQPADSLSLLAEGKKAGEVYVNGLGMAFRWCPVGEFEMGSGKAEQEMSKKWGWDASDEVRHRVKLTRGYWMQEREVSQGDWKRVMGRGVRAEVEAMLRSEQAVNYAGGKVMKVRESYGAQVGEDAGRYVGVEDDGYPIIWVDWKGARAYCEALTQRERQAGRLGAGWRYALPTEAQWEYACRAGSKEEVYGGKMTILGKSNAPVLDRIAWYGGNSAVGYAGSGFYFRGKVWSTAGREGMAYAGGVAGPRRCGEKGGNAWGMRDMIGNVWEWCADWYGEYEVKGSGVVVNPRGAVQGVARVRRGGSWIIEAAYCRAACRNGHAPAYRISVLGFRPALVPSGE